MEQETEISVIPAEAGIQFYKQKLSNLSSAFPQFQILEPLHDKKAVIENKYWLTENLTEKE